MDKSQKQQLNTLLLDLKSGNLDALDKIYELTNSAVFSVALSVVHNSEEAKDIMMSTYLRVREKINYYTPNTNGYAWVLTMAKNLSINENKKINRSTPTDFQENEFVLARDMIISSDLQTLIVGFLCDYKKPNDFKNESWVELTGEIIKGNYHGDMPIINVKEIKQIEKPQNDIYVYPPDDSFVPTVNLF